MGLGFPELSWGLLGSPGVSWPLLGSPGLPWALLGSPGLSWALLGSPGLSGAFLWLSLAFLGSPRFSRALSSPGLAWGLLNSPGLSWALLGSLGFSMGPYRNILYLLDLQGQSLARNMFAVVRHSRMKCLHDIGRDSWVWGEQETLEMMNSPHKVGEEALTERIPLSGGNGVARG